MADSGQINKVIINANVITMNPNMPQAEAIAIKGDKIVAVGTNEEVFNKMPGCEVLDAKGMTVLPGFIDNHVHFLQTGYSIISLNLVEYDDWTQVVDAVAHEAKNQPKGSMIMGYGYDDHLFPDYQTPNRWDLDRAAPHHMVWLNRVDFHSSIVNSNTLKALNLPSETEGIEVDEQGIPVGILRAEADVMARKLSSSLISDDFKHLSVQKASQEALAGGITTVVAMEGDVSYGKEDVKFLLKNKHRSKTRLEIFYETLNIDQVLDLGLPRIGGCVFLDGSIGSWTAAVSEPYHDHEDPAWRGLLYLDQEYLNEFILRAHKEGLQITMHAIGDRAIEQLLSAYKHAFDKFPVKNHRHRIEHFELPKKEHIKMAKELGLILSMQPAFEYHWGGPDNLYGMRLGPERIKRTNPFREILDEGITVAAGSDAAVTNMAPFFGIYGAVNHPSINQRVTLYEALEMFTINGAVALGIEHERGSLEVGKLADLVLIEENPFEISPERLKDIEIVMTLVGGEIVYSRPFMPTNNDNLSVEAGA